MSFYVFIFFLRLFVQNPCFVPTKIRNMLQLYGTQLWNAIKLSKSISYVIYHAIAHYIRSDLRKQDTISSSRKM